MAQQNNFIMSDEARKNLDKPLKDFDPVEFKRIYGMNRKQFDFLMNPFDMTISAWAKTPEYMENRRKEFERLGQDDTAK